MHEPATALTDYLLAAVAACCFVRLRAIGGARRPLGALIFFAGFAAAAFCGGTWHGFFSGQPSEGPGALWWATLVCSGVASSGLAVIGIERFGLRTARRLLIGCAAFVAVFATYVWWDRRFFVSVVASGVATALCLAGLIVHARRRPRRGAELAASALALSVAASVLQQYRFAIHPLHFDHNATYHLWLLAALALFHAGNRQIAADAA